MTQNIVKVGAASAAAQRSTNDDFIELGGTTYDISDVNLAIAKVGEGLKILGKNPYSTLPMQRIKEARTLLVGALQSMPAPLARIVRPLAAAAAGPMMEAANEAVRLRMQSAHSLMKHPTQTIPLTLDAASGTFGANATASFTVQNPYQGSGGAVYNTNGIWAITGLESGALANIGGLLITSAVFAGHDYVEAALNGIADQSAAGSSGAAAVGGWDFSIFASDKRYRDHTVFSPWNLQGAGGIIGSIMRETGQVKFKFLNVGNTTFAGGAFHVHVKASLCGSPFQPDHVQKMFVPWRDQLVRAQQLSQDMPNRFRQAFSNDNIRGIEEDVETAMSLPMYT